MSRRFVILAIGLIVFAAALVTMITLVSQNRPNPVSGDVKTETFNTAIPHPTQTEVVVPTIEEPTSLPKDYQVESYPGVRMPTATPTIATVAFICDGAPASRMMGITRGRSNYQGTPLRVRQNPGKQGKQAGNIANGVPFEVVGGPVCSDRIIWWQIRANQLNGWVAEGEGHDYFIEPN